MTRRSLALAVLTTWLATAGVGAQPPAPRPRPVVSSAQVDLLTNTLTLRGQNLLPRTAMPAVTMGGTALTVFSATAEQIVAALPVTAPGTYLVTLSRDASRVVDWTTDVTIGEAGPRGLRGEPGPKGAPGDMGAPGDAGAQGAKGATGDPGAPGNVGPAGATGSQGAVGARGANGLLGPTGPEGDDGAAGFDGLGILQLVSGPDTTSDIAVPGGHLFRLHYGGPLGGSGAAAFDLAYQPTSAIEVVRLRVPGVYQLDYAVTFDVTPLSLPLLSGRGDLDLTVGFVKAAANARLQYSIPTPLPWFAPGDVLIWEGESEPYAVRIYDCGSYYKGGVWTSVRDELEAGGSYIGAQHLSIVDGRPYTAVVSQLPDVPAYRTASGQAILEIEQETCVALRTHASSAGTLGYEVQVLDAHVNILRLR